MRMQTPIYWLILWQNPQAIQDLDDYQRKNWGTHIDIPSDPFEKMPVSLHGQIENIEQIDRSMRRRPHYPKGARWRG